MKDEYFEWIIQVTLGKTHRSLLEHLHEIEFYALHPLDQNRLEDGLYLKYRYCEIAYIPRSTAEKVLGMKKCSVLEMMLALAFKIEDSIMEDCEFGDRTALWFWTMIRNLGLYELDDKHYDEKAEEKINKAVETMMDRTYDRDGSNGALFLVKGANRDFRKTEIWYQMCLFLNTLL